MPIDRIMLRQSPRLCQLQIDPMDATAQQIDAGVFAAKLWRSWSAVQSRKPNAIPWRTMAFPDPRYFEPDGRR